MFAGLARQLLLEADCGTVNIGDKDGRTPLHLAALGGHVVSETCFWGHTEGRSGGILLVGVFSTVLELLDQRATERQRAVLTRRQWTHFWTWTPMLALATGRAQGTAGLTD